MPIIEYTEKPNDITVPPSKYFIVVRDNNEIIGDIAVYSAGISIVTNSKIVTGTKLQIEAYIKSNNLTFNEED
jgi:hypothetical protein